MSYLWRAPPRCISLLQLHHGTFMNYFLPHQELEPVDLAKARAESRYKRRKARLDTIFGDEPPLIEAIGTDLCRIPAHSTVRSHFLQGTVSSALERGKPASIGSLGSSRVWWRRISANLVWLRNKPRPILTTIFSVLWMKRPRRRCCISLSRSYVCRQ